MTDDEKRAATLRAIAENAAPAITPDEMLEALCKSIRNQKYEFEFFAQTLRNLENIGEARAAYARALESSLDFNPKYQNGAGYGWIGNDKS